MIIYWNVIEKSATDPALIPDYIASDYFTRGFPLNKVIFDGWFDPQEVWTYASASTFTVSGDQTTKYTKGTRLKFTQGTVKYGVVVSSAYSSPNTTVTIAVNTDYVIADAAISANFYSYAVCPQGYPTWFNYTPATITWGGGAAPSGDGSSKSYKFKIEGSSCTVVLYIEGFTPGTANTYFSVSLPVAAATTQPAYGYAITGVNHLHWGYVSGASMVVSFDAVAANRLIGSSVYVF